MQVAVVEVRDGVAPWPYKFQKGALPGKLLKLRVVKSWKGSFTPGNIIYGWTAGRNVEDTFYWTELGTQTIVFYPKGSPHELMACFTVDPDRIQRVSEQLDQIVGPALSSVSPNTSLERARER